MSRFPHHGGLHPSQVEVADSESYARTTRTFSNGGRSLYPEHLALYRAEHGIVRPADDKELADAP